MKQIDRKNWDSIKNLETVSGKFADGREYRLIKDPKTGLIELILDHRDLRNQNQTESFQPVILTEGFYSD